MRRFFISGWWHGYHRPTRNKFDQEQTLWFKREMELWFKREMEKWFRL